MPKPQPASDASENRRNLAYRRLLAKILGGGLPARVSLSEVALAREFGISRTPLREAIGQLVAEGMLEQIPGRGAVVRQITRHDIVELYELREALEVFAVGRAASRGLNGHDLRELDQLVEEVERLRLKLVESGNAYLDVAGMRKFAAVDLAFHSLLLQSANNSRIMKVVNDTRLLIRIFAIRHQGHSPSLLAQIHRYHRECLDAVARGDAHAAQRKLSEHIQVSLQERIQAHDDWERQKTISRAFLDGQEAGELVRGVEEIFGDADSEGGL